MTLHQRALPPRTQPPHSSSALPAAARLTPLEEATLALCERVLALEEIVAAERRVHALTLKRLEHVQREMAQMANAMGRLAEDHRALFKALGGAA